MADMTLEMDENDLAVNLFPTRLLVRSKPIAKIVHAFDPYSSIPES